MGKPLLYSRGGDLAAAVPRIGGEIYFVKPRARKVGLYDGLAPIVGSLDEAMQHRPEFVLMDMVGDKEYPMGKVADRLRRRVPVYGVSEIAESLEMDRAFGMSVMAESGMRIPPTVLFSPGRGKPWESIDAEDRAKVHRVNGHLKEAQQFVKATGGRFVLKPLSNQATALTYVSKDPEDMTHRLANLQEGRQVPPNIPFLLQKFIDGIEISTEFWVVHGEPVFPPTGTFEIKHLFPGDLGPATGCMTSVVWAYDTPDPKIVRQTIGRPDFLAWLKKPVGPDGRTHPPYHGPIDVNAIIAQDDKKAYTLEFTARFGYSAVWCLFELLEDDLHDMFAAAAGGTLREMRLAPGFAYALRVGIPPWPFLDHIEDEPTLDRMMKIATDIDIMGPVDDPHVWLLDAQKDNDHVQTAGYDAVALEVTGHARTIEGARDSAHGLFNDIVLADKMARMTDGADRAIRDLARLHAFGYDTPQMARIAPRTDEKTPEKPPPLPTEPRAQEQALRAMATLGAGSVPPGGPAGRPGAPGSHMVAGQASPTAAGAAAHQAASSGADSGGVSGSGAKSVAG